MFTRYIFAGLALFAILGWQAPSYAAATSTGTMIDLEGVKVAKTVWDISTGNEARFNSRIRLIKQTADGFRKKGITPQFVVLIRGGATKFVAKSVEGTKFTDEPVEDLNATQAALEALTTAGVPVRVCAIAMKGTKVKPDNVIKFITQVDNSFENLIALQIKGYAYMEVE